MGWHSSKDKPRLLHLLNGDTAFSRLLQKGPSLVLLWDSGDVLPIGTQLAHLSSGPSFPPSSLSLSWTQICPLRWAGLGGVRVW